MYSNLFGLKLLKLVIMMKYKTVSQFIALITLLMLFSSCATVFGGKMNTISIQQANQQSTQVENVKVFLDGELLGNAPLKMRVSKYRIQEASLIEIKSDGFETIEYQIVRRPHVGYVLLDVVTGAIPLIIDVINGNIYRPNTRHIKYDLLPLNNEDLLINDSQTLKN